MAVEDELVLCAHGVHERDEARVVACADDQHLLALALLPDVERRRRDVHEELRAREREVGRRRPRLPQVFADGRADQRLPDPDEDELAPGCEVAILVEDAVVGQEPLRIDGLHAPVRTDGARVVQVAVEERAADERDHVVHFGGDPLERAPRLADEGRPEQEVLRRVPRHGELGEEDDVSPDLARLRDPLQDPLPVPLEVADEGVDLREREPHRSLRL